MLTSHLQQILEWFVPALYRGLSITNLVSVQTETLHSFLGVLIFSHHSFCSTLGWTWLVIFVKVTKYKGLPSWNDHYNEMLVYLKPGVWVWNALKPGVWVSQISFLDAQTQLLSPMQDLSTGKQWNWLGTHLSIYLNRPKKSQAFFKPSSVKVAPSPFTPIHPPHSLLMYPPTRRYHIPLPLPL